MLSAHNTEIQTYTFRDLPEDIQPLSGRAIKGYIPTQIYLLDLHVKVVGTDIKSYKQTCKIISFQSTEKGMVFVSGSYDLIPLQYSCLENPMDGGAWWAAVHGVTKSPARLSDFTFTFHFHALEKEMATHSSVLAWRIPGTGEPDGLPSVGLHRVGHD